MENSVLASFHFPLADTRSFFSDELGRIPHLGDDDRRKELIFLRSLGAPNLRSLGGGDNVLSEVRFFSLNRALSMRNSSNLAAPPGFGKQKTLARLYALDQATMRAEIGFVGKNTPTRHRPHLDAICQYLLNTKFTSPKSIFSGTHTLSQSGKFISKIVQSRTTLEIFLKKNFNISCVFSGAPLMFIEGFTDEINVGSRAQLLPLAGELGKIRLYHFYPATDMRGWVILRDRSSFTKENDEQGARILRMYLSRLYSQANTFRMLAKSIPDNIATVNKIKSDSKVLPDLYVKYISQNRRFINSMSRDISEITGHEYGRIATIAHNMIKATEVDDILEKHDRIVSVRNIFRNFESDIRIESELSESLTNQAEAGKSTNYILSIFSSMKNVHQQNVPTIARGTVDIRKVLPHLQNFSEFISIRGGGLDDARFRSIETILKEIENLANAKTLYGPGMLSRLEQIKDIVQKMNYNKSEALELIKRIEMEIAI